jgi:hypothetical protein
MVLEVGWLSKKEPPSSLEGALVSTVMAGTGQSILHWRKKLELKVCLTCAWLGLTDVSMC